MRAHHIIQAARIVTCTSHYARRRRLRFGQCAAERLVARNLHANEAGRVFSRVGVAPNCNAIAVMSSAYSMARPPTAQRLPELRSDSILHDSILHGATSNLHFWGVGGPRAMVALSPRVATLIWAPRGSDVLRLEVIAAQHAAGRLARTAVDARVIVGSGHRRSARDAWRQRRDPPLGCSFLAGTAFAKFEAESLFLGNAFTSNSAKAGHGTPWSLHGGSTAPGAPQPSVVAMGSAHCGRRGLTTHQFRDRARGPVFV